MAKKKKKNIGLKIKKIIYYFSGVLLIFLVLALYIGNNANPGNIFYFADRGFENLFYNLKFSNQAKLNYQVKLADERLIELKKVQENPIRVETLVEDYSKNLENIDQIVSKIAKNSQEDDLAEIIVDLMKIRIESFKRTLTVRKKENKNDEIEDLLHKALWRSIVLKDKLFEIGIKNIEKNPDFDSYAQKEFKKLLKVRLDDIGYAEKDALAIRPQATEEEKKELEGLINQARDIYFETRDNIGSWDNQKIYNNFKEVNKLVNEDVTDILVEISNRNLKNKKDFLKDINEN